MNENIDKNTYKALALPRKLCVLYMIAVLVLFLAGPIKWIDEWDLAAVMGVCLICLYIIAFRLGYGRNRCYVYESVETANPARIATREKYVKLLNIFVWVYLVLTVLNAFEYAGATSLSGLWANVKEALTSPDQAYYNKDVSSRSGNILAYVTLIFEPIMFITKVNAFLYYKYLNKFAKICAPFALVVEVFRWLAVGTNKGLLDVLVLLFTIYLISMQRRKITERKKANKKIFVIIIILTILFLAFFATALSARVGGEYDKSLYTDFPYNLVPEGLRFFVTKFDSYITQGYSNMIKCIRYCEWKPTFPIGHSRFLMDTAKRFFGIDVFENTYPAQLATEGVDPLVSWHSAYSWIASDISFFGIIIFMFFVGRFTSKLVKESFWDHDPISSALLYMVILGVINSSCTNYVLAYSNMMIAFWGLFVVRLVLKWRRRAKEQEAAMIVEQAGTESGTEIEDGI